MLCQAGCHLGRYHHLLLHSKVGCPALFRRLRLRPPLQIQYRQQLHLRLHLLWHKCLCRLHLHHQHSLQPCPQLRLRQQHPFSHRQPHHLHLQAHLLHQPSPLLQHRHRHPGHLQPLPSPHPPLHHHPDHHPPQAPQPPHPSPPQPRSQPSRSVAAALAEERCWVISRRLVRMG